MHSLAETKEACYLRWLPTPGAEPMTSPRSPATSHADATCGMSGEAVFPFAFPLGVGIPSIPDTWKVL